MDSPGSRPAEGHRWRRRRTDWYYIAGRGAHGSQFIRASQTNCQPAESSGMTGKGANQQEQVPCPQCGKHVQRRNLKKHQRSQHDGVRRRRHACPFCLPEVHKTYSTFQDWKNHLHTTHDQCLEDDDPLDREEYAVGFKLDRWERFHHIEGDENDRAYQRIATLRKHYGPYQGGVKGEPPGAPSTIRIPHTKGTTPDREVVPAESEFAGSDQDGSDQEDVGGGGNHSTNTSSGCRWNDWPWTSPDLTLSLRPGTSTALWWGATSRNGSSASRSRTRRPPPSLENWCSRLWLGTELFGSCTVTRARISDPKWYWRCAGCLGYTRRGLRPTTPGATDS